MREARRFVVAALGLLAGSAVAADDRGLPRTVVSPGDGAEMVLVPAGEFLMGSDDGPPNERPARRVHLDAFHSDRHEVTNARYARFLAGTGSRRPDFWNDDAFNQEAQPVVGVTRDEAQTYCRGAGKRLPTEAEWEKAARGTDGRRYPWGNRFDPARANIGTSAAPRPVAVGSYPGGASPYGALDMVGNVWEWVADRYQPDAYRGAATRNPTGPTHGDQPTVRGGAYGTNEPHWRTTTGRRGSVAGSKGNSTGFRCAAGAGGRP